jgi:hypothetical protein
MPNRDSCANGLFHRGIVVSPDNWEAIEDRIRKTGRLCPENLIRRHVPKPDAVRTNRERILTRTGSMRKAFGDLPVHPITYASADLRTAAFYASRNRSGIPMVISFEVPWDEVAVDGNDFPYRAFGHFHKIERKSQLEVHSAISHAYGPSMVDLLMDDRQDPYDRLILCEVALRDMDSIRHHAGSDLIIWANMNVSFQSAFTVPAVIEPEQIVDIRRMDLDEAIEMTPTRQEPPTFGIASFLN